MADSKITLEYIRTLIWPLFAMMVLLVFQNDIRGMISSGIELDILGVTIKGASGENIKKLLEREAQLRDAVDGLERKLREQAGLNDRLASEKEQLLEKQANLEARLAQVDIPGGVDTAELLVPLAAIEEEEMKVSNQDLQRDIQRNLNVAQMILAGPSAKTASVREREGFENILAGRWNAAMESFQAAYEAYPDYHNVSEIYGLLKNKLDALVAGDEKAVQEVLNAIVERYSWGAPEDVIARIKGKLK